MEYICCNADKKKCPASCVHLTPHIRTDCIKEFEGNVVCWLRKDEPRLYCIPVNKEWLEKGE